MVTKKLRILQIVASSQGGAAEHVVCVSKRINGSRFDFTVVMSEDDGNIIPSDFEKLGVKVVLFSISKGFSLTELLKLWTFIRSYGFDIVHCHGTRAAIFGRLAAGLSKRRPKIAYTIHGFHALHYVNPCKRELMLTLERLLGAFTDAVICVSYSDMESVVKAKLIKKEKVFTVWNGVNIKSFRDIILNKQVKRKELGISVDAFLLTTICRLHPQKDFTTLLRAFKLTLEELPRSQLLVVGDGPLREDLEVQIKRLGLETKVILTGVRRDIPEILAITDVFVLSTLWEGLPIVLLEAMASAKPVIASDVCGNREVVVNKETGILVSPGDHTAMARAILELARDPEKAKEMGKKGLARVKENFTAEKMEQNIVRIYEMLCS